MRFYDWQPYSMRGDDRIRLRHMLDAGREALGFAANRDRRDLDTDRMLVLALVKSIEIIGEAGARVSEEGRDATPDIPWPEIVGMRNRLVHAYFDVNLDVVWEDRSEGFAVSGNSLAEGPK